MLHGCCKAGTLTVSICCSGNTVGSPLLELKYSASPFGFAVVRNRASKSFPIFNTAGLRLVFKVDWHASLKVLYFSDKHHAACKHLQLHNIMSAKNHQKKMACPRRTSTLRLLQPFLPMQRCMVWARMLPPQALFCGEMASPTLYGHATRLLTSLMSTIMAPILSSWMSALVIHQTKIAKHRVQHARSGFSSFQLTDSKELKLESSQCF